VVNRRAVLTGAAGVAVAAAVGVPAIAAGRRADGDAAAAWSPPRTLAEKKTVATGHLRVSETSFPLSHLGVTWSGTHAQLRLRTAQGWGPWQTLGTCGGAPTDHGRAGGAVLVRAPGAVAYELSAPGASVSPAAEVVELNTVGSAAVQSLAPASGFSLPDGTRCAVPYLSRAAWGADESLRFTGSVESWPVEYFPVQTLTVHHTAGTNNDPDPAATVRAIYHLQAISKEWGDIGYHLMIDEAGRVYEARVSGADGFPVFAADLGPDGRPRMSVGGHVKGYNAGNIGVCLLGDFTSRLPTTAALSTLSRVMVSLAGSCRLNAVGTSHYVDPVSGSTRTVRTISGHRDWAATQCPGNTYYPYLDLLRSGVAQKLTPDVPRPGKGTARPKPTTLPKPVPPPRRDR
jgi:hypothetical protein